MAASGSEAPNCGGLANELPEGTFWQIALGVCRAIVDGADWPSTTTVPAAPQGANDYETCLNEELAAMLQRALSWHAENPGRQPKVDYPEGNSTSPCQARIYKVRVLSAEDSNLGALPGEVPVAITGSAMDGSLSIAVDGIKVDWDFREELPNGGITRVIAFVPLAEEPRTATIEITTDRGPMEATVELPGSGASPSPTDVTTKTDPPTTDPPETESQATQPPDE